MRAQTTTCILAGALSLVQGEERTTQSARGGEDGGCCEAGEAGGTGLEHNHHIVLSGQTQWWRKL